MSRSRDRGIMMLKENARVREINPTEELLNEDFIGRAIWECLKEGDSDGVMEVIATFLEAASKSHLAKEAFIARSTVYSVQKKGGITYG